jgi:hypothetical protein
LLNQDRIPWEYRPLIKDYFQAIRPTPQKPGQAMSSAIDQQVATFQEQFKRVKEEVSKIIVGYSEIIDGVIMSLLASGHVLLEGVPGLGKTKLVSTLSDVMHLKFSRIQFTPDLMPADITGTNVVQEDALGEKFLEFQPGPIFSNIVLADEVNRATPKTQSALLEAMEERSVTVGKTSPQARLSFFRVSDTESSRDGRNVSTAGSAVGSVFHEAEGRLSHRGRPSYDPESNDEGQRARSRPRS